MNHSILSAFKNLPYFTIAGFRQIAANEIGDDDLRAGSHARVALNRWVKAGRLIQLKKGVYMHPDFYTGHRQEAAFTPMVSAILLPQSYLSLEYILQQHGILTDITYPVTAITIKNTHTITNPLGTFVYRHIRPDFYQGFTIFETNGISYADASLAKALFDYLYLRPISGHLNPQQSNLAEDLRLNLDEFTPREQTEFAGYVTASKMSKMQRILKNLEFHLWRP
jgi:predicted transcriptional regulator of viral defense system